VLPDGRQQASQRATRAVGSTSKSGFRRIGSPCQMDGSAAARLASASTAQ
jgi:hypothetical protein